MNSPATHSEMPFRVVGATPDGSGPTHEVVQVDLNRLHLELQHEVDRLMAEVAAQEDASVLLESKLIELSDRLTTTRKRRSA